MSIDQIINDRLEYEEINRWLRHTESIWWLITFALINFSIIAILNIIKEEDYRVLVFSTINICTWHGYLGYSKYINIRIHSLLCRMKVLDTDLQTNLEQTLSNSLQAPTDDFPKPALWIWDKIEPSKFIVSIIYLGYFIYFIWIALLLKYIYYSWS